MSWKHESRRIGAILWKDFTSERRTKANFNAVLFMAVLTLILFGFALGPETQALRDAAGGVMWLTILFSGVLAFNRSYEQELEGGSMDSLLLYPGQRRSIFVGKVIANLAFVLLVEVVLVPLATILYDLPMWRVAGQLAGVLILGTIGFVTLGTFYAAMASRIRAREVMLPLLLFPMLIPLLVGAVEATTAMLAGDVMGDSRVWVRLMVIFDAIFIVICLWAFDFVIEE
ncbi:MAG TPA: heme exporter protein CcmB [Longimicrobiales bacterium]